MDLLHLHTLVTLLLVVGAEYQSKASYENEKEPRFWNDVAKEELDRAVNKTKPIVGVAKNIILFLGDGMGVTTVTAARILGGQLLGKNGEEHKLSFEKFPHIALSKTYNVDYQTPDSAGTGTAFLTGVKTNMGVIGVNAKVNRSNCSSATEDTHLTSILRWSLAKGKSTGVVTTTRVTHATPASAYAHTPDRDWEGMVPSDQEPCTDIASQLVYNNSDISVVLGGGRQEFLPYNTSDPEAEDGVMVDGRNDTLNLVEEWKRLQKEKGRRFRYVTNQTEFDDVDVNETDALLGLFNPSHMQYEVNRETDIAGEPSLAEMTEKAIDILKKNDKGFFLLVEGGRIDMGHHENRAGVALYDTLAFAEAVDKAVSKLDEEDSLIIVTADHSHAFAFAGYPGRGNGILDIVQDNYGVVEADDDKPYTTLVYGNGPGHTGIDTTLPGRQNLTSVNTTDLHYRQQAIVPLVSETHGGEDVAIYARGPMAHLFHGVHEQNYIPHVMAYASCVGAYVNEPHCVPKSTNPAVPGSANPNDNKNTCGGAARISVIRWTELSVWLMMGAMCLFFIH